MDDETRRYAEIIKAKHDRLFVLDKQAARYGIDVPPHIEMERVSLTEELRMVETALESPVRANVGDELGPRGRFVVNHQQNRVIQEQNSDIEKLSREIKQSIAAVAVKLDRFIDDSIAWRVRTEDRMRRFGNGGIVIAILVVLIIVAVAIFVTYVLTKGGL